MLLCNKKHCACKQFIPLYWMVSLLFPSVKARLFFATQEKFRIIQIERISITWINICIAASLVKCIVEMHRTPFPSVLWHFNPLPNMPILCSSNSAANKDMMSNIWTNGDSIIWLSKKHGGKRRNLHYEEFLLFPQCFQKLSVVDALKWVFMKWRVKKMQSKGNAKKYLHYMINGRI